MQSRPTVYLGYLLASAAILSVLIFSQYDRFDKVSIPRVSWKATASEVHPNRHQFSRDFGWRLLDRAQYTPPMDKPLRIGAFCRVSVLHKWGGMQQVAYDRWKAGARHYGWNVTYFTTSIDDPKYTTMYMKDGIQTYFVPGSPSMQNSQAYSKGALSKVKEMHAQEPFDLFLTDSNPLEHDTIAELRKLAPIGATFHGVGIDGLLSSINEAALGAARQPDTVNQNILNALSHRAVSAGREAAFFGYAYDFIVGITPLATRNFREVYRIASRQLFTILNGIDTARYIPTSRTIRAEARKIMGIPEDALVLSFAGKLETGKGFFELAEVAPAILRYVPNLHIIVAGAGSGTSTCRTLDQENTNFHCLGALDSVQLAVFYQASSMHIEPALHYLGLNTVVLEAVCTGLPVISADAARMTETFGYGPGTPAYFSMGDRLDMVKAVVEAAAMDEQDREAWGQELRRRWCPRFSLETEATQYNEMFWWQVHQRQEEQKIRS